ncbi:hypothetical protein [Leucobacter sp. 7(1)]|uniref:hypothetical protein n=1 Tax=Leucobacter sp. 7(1) TaxID=1255613 RepID=UPI00112061E5|nr:hypothetical protein [Leucobacter sp. 7(1)]
MKKHLIALPLAALAVISMTGCSYPGSDEVAAEYQKQVHEQQAQTQPAAPAPAQPSQDAEQGWQTPGSEVESSAPAETESAAPSQEAGTTIDLGSDEVKGTVYLEAVQSFSPYLSKFVVDGDTLHYSRYTCLGEDEGSRATGMLKPWSVNEQKKEIQWPGDSDLQTGPVAVSDQFLETMYVTGDEMATSDLEAQQNAFSSMCLDAGQSIAEFIL